MKIAVVVTARPSWAKLSPLIPALQADGWDVDLIGAAYALTRTRGGIVDAAFTPTTRLTSALDADTGEAAAMTTGLLAIQLAQHLERTRPAVTVVMADRYETLAVSMAGAYLGIPVLHIQGGEVSGDTTIDNRVRRANTALSDWHAVSNEAARARVIACGAWPERVVVTGCPSIDLARMALSDAPLTAEELARYGTGAAVDPERPFTLLMWNPTAGLSDDENREEWTQAWCAARGFRQPVIAFWPGQDAGHDAVSTHIRAFSHYGRWAHFVRAMPPARFLRLMSQADVMVGNSSAIIRERSYTGPAAYVVIGDRQRGRETEPGPGSTLYGDGRACARIVALCRQAFSGRVSDPSPS